MGADDQKSPLVDSLSYMQSGMMIVAPMLGLGALGYWLDGRWQTKPWLMLAGLIVGMIGGFVNFFRFVLQAPGGRPPGNGPPRGPAPGGRR